MYIGYLNFVIFLLIVTGILIIRFDVKGYKREKMKKELKFARFVGWLNILAGLLTLVFSYVYRNWFW